MLLNHPSSYICIEQMSVLYVHETSQPFTEIKLLQIRVSQSIAMTRLMMQNKLDSMKCQLKEEATILLDSTTTTLI